MLLIVMGKFLNIFSLLQQKLGINKSIGLAGGSRFMTMALGPIGSVIVVYTLTPTEQGLYYVFLSLLGLKTFFELGVTACIGQLVPHNLASDGCTPSPEFLRISSRWMTSVSILYFTFSTTIGTTYLIWCGYSDYFTIGCWLVAVIPSALSGIQEGKLQLIYGCNLVDDVTRIRWTSLIVQYVIQWALLLSGASLLSFSLSAFAMWLSQHYLIQQKYKGFLTVRVTPDKEKLAVIRKELIGLMKKAGVVYLAGYFVLQIQQPILFRIAGAEASARYGFTLLICNSLIGFSLLWGMTAFPGIARKVADGEVSNAFHDFKRSWQRSAFIATLGLIASIVAVEMLRLSPTFTPRLLPFMGALPIALSIWIQNLSNVGSYWPRAHCQEPLAPAAIVQMIVTPLAVWFTINNLHPDMVGWANLFSWTVGGTIIAFAIVKYFPLKLTLPSSL